MATKEITFTVSKSAGVLAYTISLDGTPRPLGATNKGTFALETGKTHSLSWHFWGEGHSSISIVGTDAGNEVVKVANAVIPTGGSQDFSGINFVV